MNILKSIVTSNGMTLQVHKVASIKVYLLAGGTESIMASVLSWPDSQTYVSGNRAIYNENYPIQLSTVSGTSFAEQAVAYLVNTDTSPFYGGTIEDLPVGGGTLEGAKALKKVEMQAARAAAETGGFTWNSMEFSSTFEEQGRLAAAVTVAIINKIDSTAFNMKWQLKDGSNTTLNKNEFIDVAKALADHINAVFENWRTKKQAINDATTIEEVQAITW